MSRRTAGCRETLTFGFQCLRHVGGIGNLGQAQVIQPRPEPGKVFQIDALQPLGLALGEDIGRATDALDLQARVTQQGQEDRIGTGGLAHGIERLPDTGICAGLGEILEIHRDLGEADIEPDVTRSVSATPVGGKHEGGSPIFAGPIAMVRAIGHGGLRCGVRS